MKSLFTYFAKSKKHLLRVGLFVTTIAVFFSCLHLRAVYYPEEVETNSTFEVTMIIDMDNPLSGGPTPDSRNAYGFVGVLLPVGWTIDEESMVYEYIAANEESVSSTGVLLFNEEMTNYCIDTDYELWGDEYYWQGFRADERLKDRGMDHVVVRFNVMTDDQVGSYSMLVGVQETSYDKGDNIPGSEGNTLVDNKGAEGDGAFYRCEGSDEYSKEYLNITVVQGATGVEYSKEDKENYNVVALGNGQILVNLKNDQKIGAQAIVYDINGKQVASQQLNKTTNILDAALNPGVHFVAIQQDGIRSSKKILVK